MRSSARRSDDADLIRARLRVVLAELDRVPGWVPPEDLLDDPPADGDRDDGLADDDRTDDRTDDDSGLRRPGTGAGPEPVDPDDALPGGLGRHRAPGVTARLDPGRSGARALWLAGLLAALLVVGWTWADRPQVEPVTAEAAGPPTEATGPAGQPPPSGPDPTPTPAAATGVVVVSVVGQVARPGLVTLPAGARVADALAAAGGLLPEGDPAAVNAAAPLRDGEQIAVGVPGAAPPTGGGGGSAGGGGLLDLNTATVAELDALPGIGPVLAQRIVDHRSAAGRFTSVDQLDDVPGIGPAISAELAALVTV